jgi:hypothetical protein
MSQCPFLSTSQGDEQCFEDCALLNGGESADLCPFKTLPPKESNKKRNSYEYGFFQEEDEDEEEDEILEKCSEEYV